MDSKLPPEPRRQDAGGDALGSPSGSDNNDDGDEPRSEEKVNANTTIDDGNTSSSGSSEGDGRASMPSQSRIEPEECDVLFGRGRPFILHPGNIGMKEIVVGLKEIYQKASRDDKRNIVQTVIERIRASGGDGNQVRFLRSTNRQGFGPWVVATDEEVKKKIGHVLRSKFDLRCVSKPTIAAAAPSSSTPTAAPQLVANTNWNAPYMTQHAALVASISQGLSLQTMHPAAAAALLNMTAHMTAQAFNPLLRIASLPGLMAANITQQQLQQVVIPGGAFAAVPGLGQPSPPQQQQQQPPQQQQQPPQQQQQPPPPQQTSSDENVASAATSAPEANPPIEPSLSMNSDNHSTEDEFKFTPEDIFDL